MSWARYRLHQENGRAWCAAKRAVNEWVLVDLGVASKVSGIVTQGRGDISEWVTHFMVSYSLDAYKWEFARDIYGTKKVWYFFLIDYWECAVMAPGVAAKRAVKEWVLFDLSVASNVSGIVTQGQGDISGWVTYFMVSYSLDAYK